MSAILHRARRLRVDAAAGSARARTLTPAEIAWLALVPVALVMLLVVLVLGPRLGHALLRPGSDMLWPHDWWESQGHPEPTKLGRYMVAVLAPLPLVVAVFASPRRTPRLRPGTIAAIALVSQLVVLAFVVVALLAQHNVIHVNRVLPPVFGVSTLVVAAALVAATLLVLRSPLADRVGRIARETTARRVVGLTIAAAFAGAWLLECVTTDRLAEDSGLMNWTMTDAFAVLDGRTPLVDYHIIYGKLVPILAAVPLALVGTTTLVYTITMATLSFLAVLAVYGIFHRIVRSSLLTLALFLPFLALSDVQHTMIMPAMWPMRYGGAFLMAWLTARQIDRGGARGRWLLFFLGTFVAVNNTEFGLGSVLASLVALLCADLPRSRRAALRLTRDVAGGTLAGVTAISAFTLIHGHALPNPALLTEWPRIFANLGWFGLPAPALGLHLAIYATFVAAIVLAAVRIRNREANVLLTSMLVWSGVLGLLAGSYYMGRSDDLKLVSMFGAWSFALSLLTIAAVRALAARRWRRPQVAELLVLFGFALAVCSIARIPLPSKQIARLTAAVPDPRYRAFTERLVDARTRPGEHVAIMLPEGYRIAYDLGLKNVSPYVLQNAVVTRSQMQRVIDVALEEGVRTIFLPAPHAFGAPHAFLGEANSAPQQLQAFEAAGYTQRSEDEGILELRRG